MHVVVLRNVAWLEASQHLETHPFTFFVFL